jgi:hypothetical protein
MPRRGSTEEVLPGNRQPKRRAVLDNRVIADLSLSFQHDHPRSRFGLSLGLEGEGAEKFAGAKGQRIEPELFGDGFGQVAFASFGEAFEGDLNIAGKFADAIDRYRNRALLLPGQLERERRNLGFQIGKPLAERVQRRGNGSEVGSDLALLRL